MYIDEEGKKVFFPAPIVSFKSSRKLSSYLVRAKLHPLSRTVGSFKCKKPFCEVSVNIIETGTFTSDNKCLIYLLTCNQCKKFFR